MTKKFDELYNTVCENIKVGFPISVQNPSREVPYTVGYDMGQELNDEQLALIADLIDDNGRLTNPYHPLNLKVRNYMNQLKAMSHMELSRLGELIGMKDAGVHNDDNIINAIVNHLGEDPENWKVLSPYIFTEAEKMKDDPCWGDHEMVGKKMKNGKEVPNCVPKNETAEDDSEWVAHKSEDDNWMFGEEDDEELDERVVKDKKFRKGKLTTVVKTDKDDTKVKDGKEVKLTPVEKKNRQKAAKEREQGGNVARKRQRSFKDTIKAKRQKLQKKKMDQ